MKVVIDTNILWISIPRASPSNWLIHDLINQKYSLCVTTDILNVLKKRFFPWVNVITLEEFKDIMGH